jgi:CHAT domain-containing protein/tetratricopeptide (TPR) repeat protein
MGPVAFQPAFLFLVASVLQPGPVGQPLPGGQPEKPALPQKLLINDDARRVEELGRRAAELSEVGRYAEAQVPAREILGILTRAQGATHWRTADAKRDLQTLEQIAALPGAAQAELTEARRLDRELSRLGQQGRYREGIPLAERVVAIRQRHLGEEHGETAKALTQQAFVVENAGQATEAEALYRRALAVRQKLLGPEHPSTAQSYSNLAGALLAQGKHAEADRLFGRALDAYRVVFGGEDMNTAMVYNNLAVSLEKQGKYDEGERLGRRALAIHRRVRGEHHEDTALSYNNVARILSSQGRHAEAEPLYRRALTTFRERLGEEHPYATVTENNLAQTLDAQGRYAEAEFVYRRALEVHRRVLGEEHPRTLVSYTNLASYLDAQGKQTETEPVYRRTLETRLQVLGKDHPETGVNYRDLAVNLDEQHRYAQAEPLHRQALALFEQINPAHPFAILSLNSLASNLAAQGKDAEAEALNRQALARSREALGEDHPDTVSSYTRLAARLVARGEYEAAEALLHRAAKGFEAARQRISFAGLERAGFAAGHSPLPLLAVAAAGSGKPVAAWESLEKNLARGLLDDLAARPLRGDERSREQGLRRELTRLDEQMAGLLRAPRAEAASRERIEEVRKQREAVQAEFAQFQAELAGKYGVAAGQVYDLPRIQAHLPPDTALMAWVDLKHLGKAADPRGEHWACVVRHRGPPAWTRLPGSGRDDAWTLGDDQLAFQARRAFGSRPEGLQEEWRGLARRLYAQRLAAVEKHLEAGAGLPRVRHLIVLPSARLAGIPVEVLTERYSVSYAPSATLLTWLHEKRLEAEGEGRRRRPASILALGDPAFEPAPTTLRRAPVAPARGPRGESFPSLPGTRREVQAIGRLFSQAELLLGSEASEPNLDRLAAAGRLRDFRFLHFATHGVLDETAALRSALILAQDKLPDPLEQVLAGQEVYDGRLTAEQMLRGWQLDADLVTLSACQTGLGRYSGGEGYVGFSQALFLSGARSLVLSWWKVDDTATALLMTRFYENLLGSRAGVAGPLPKAQALAEAKSWLRALNADDVPRLVAGLPDDARGAVRTRQPSATPAPAKPFAHPYYWSGFILIGDPR